jgi:anti-sigma-K factor RskA
MMPGQMRRPGGSRTRAAKVHSLMGAYVMDAVTPAERAAFERHLPGCEQCREDIRGLRETTARLAQAAAVPPRPQLREQTLQAAELVRQLPPLTGEESGHSRGMARLRSSGPAGVPRPPWLAAAAAAVAVILASAAVVLGLHAGQMQNKLTATQRRDASIAAIMGARDAVRLTAAVRTGGMATVVMSHQARALVFVVTGLPRLSAGHAYELWLVGPGGSASAGMLSPAGHPMMVVSKLQTGDLLSLTVEPAGGSPRPTTAPVVTVSLSR